MSKDEYGVTNDLAARLRKLQAALDADVIDADAYEAGLAKLRQLRRSSLQMNYP